MGRQIQGLGNEDYQMKDSDGAAARLKKNGNYCLLNKEIKIGDKGTKSEGGKVRERTTLSITQVVQDDDAQGAVLYDSFAVEGVIENGQNKGQKNVQRLTNMCLSAGRMDLAKLTMQETFDLDEVVAGLKGQKVYGFVGLKTDDLKGDGTLKSQVIFYIKPERYESSKQSGANFRIDPDESRITGKTGGGQKKTTGNTGGTGGTGGATPKVDDALAGDV